jgi:hypothetical protein
MHERLTVAIAIDDERLTYQTFFAAISVSNTNGRPVTGLTDQDITVRVFGAPPWAPIEETETYETYSFDETTGESTPAGTVTNRLLTITELGGGLYGLTRRRALNSAWPPRVFVHVMVAKGDDRGQAVACYQHGA